MSDRERSERLHAARERISAACKRSGRDEGSVTLVAASKTRTWEEVESLARLGVTDFGENYVQEALVKQACARGTGGADLRWHLIGILQSNKAKLVPGNFLLFHALDSLALASRIDRAAGAAGVEQECLIEVNLDLEAGKGGVPEAQLPRLLDQLSPLPNVRISGLMCIPAPSLARDPRLPFARLRALRDQMNAAGAYRGKLDRLSMGMSADFEAAILEGATHVRLGTTLFGERGPQ